MIKHIKINQKGKDFGMFALINQVLGLLQKNIDVVIDFRKYFGYYDDNIIDTDNIWEYYFDQPCGDKSIKEVYDKIESGEIEDYVIGNFSVCADITPFVSFEKIPQISNIINDKLKLKQYIWEVINVFHNDYMKGKKILGIQIRGTDLTRAGHAKGQKHDIKKLLQIVDDKLNDYDKLFLITDEKMFRDIFIYTYTKKLLYYSSTISDNGAAIHKSPLKGYQAGLEVIIEGYLLSMVNYLLAMRSNISLFAIMRSNMPFELIDGYLDYKYL